MLDVHLERNRASTRAPLEELYSHGTMTDPGSALRPCDVLERLLRDRLGHIPIDVELTAARERLFPKKMLLRERRLPFGSKQ